MRLRYVLPRSSCYEICAEHVTEELVAVFSRVGVPREILTDGNHWNVEEKQNAKLLSTSP